MAPNPHFGRSSSSYAAGFGFAASAVQLKTHRPLYRSEEAEEAAEARRLQGAERERQGARRRRSSWHHRDGASRRVLVERARHQCIDSSDATGCVQKGAATWEMGNLSKGLRQGPDAEMPDSRSMGVTHFGNSGILRGRCCSLQPASHRRTNARAAHGRSGAADCQARGVPPTTLAALRLCSHTRRGACTCRSCGRSGAHR